MISEADRVAREDLRRAVEVSSATELLRKITWRCYRCGAVRLTGEKWCPLCDTGAKIGGPDDR
jgi:rubrerythrin